MVVFEIVRIMNYRRPQVPFSIPHSSEIQYQRFFWLQFHRGLPMNPPLFGIVSELHQTRLLARVVVQHFFNLVFVDGYSRAARKRILLLWLGDGLVLERDFLFRTLTDDLLECSHLISCCNIPRQNEFSRNFLITVEEFHKLGIENLNP